MAKNTKNLIQLQKQREQIDKQITAAQRSMQVNVDRLKREIKKLGLTAQDLFGETKALKSTPSSAKYAHPDGSIWSGKGPRPGWLKSAIDAGAALEDFLIGTLNLNMPSRKKAVAVKRRGPAKPRAAKKAAAVKKTAKKAGVAHPKKNTKVPKTARSATPKSKAGSLSPIDTH